MNAALFGNRIFEDIIKLRWHHIGLKWVLNPMSGVIIRRPCEDTGTQRHKGEDGQVKMKAEMGVNHL